MSRIEVELCRVFYPFLMIYITCSFFSYIVISNILQRASVYHMCFGWGETTSLSSDNHILNSYIPFSIHPFFAILESEIKFWATPKILYLSLSRSPTFTDSPKFRAKPWERISFVLNMHRLVFLLCLPHQYNKAMIHITIPLC